MQYNPTVWLWIQELFVLDSPSSARQICTEGCVFVGSSGWWDVWYSEASKRVSPVATAGGSARRRPGVELADDTPYKPPTVSTSLSSHHCLCISSMIILLHHRGWKMVDAAHRSPGVGCLQSAPFNCCHASELFLPSLRVCIAPAYVVATSRRLTVVWEGEGEV